MELVRINRVVMTNELKWCVRRKCADICHLGHNLPPPPNPKALFVPIIQIIKYIYLLVNSSEIIALIYLYQGTHG